VSLKKISFNPGDVPAKPGVYLFRDSFGAVIYTGKAANLRKRVSHYFQESGRRSADPKLRSLVNSIASWEFLTVKNEEEALILEAKLIKDYAPRYNVLMRDDKRFLLVKINIREKFPRLALARVKKNDGFEYFGPFPKGSALRDTVDFLTRYFGLRSCRAAEPGENERRHCLAGIIKDCSGPCVGKISPEGYKAKVEEMMGVLRGDITALLLDISEKMRAAAADMKFERAAALRDVAANIEDVFGVRRRNFSHTSIPSPAGDDAVEDLQKALGLPSPPSEIEAMDISNISGMLAVGSVVRFTGGRPDRANYRRFRIREVSGPDDFAMMAEVVKRHFGRKLAENRPLPGLTLIDGGKGQLSAAISALAEIKAPPVPLVGLAKRNEEIFIPGRENPVVLDRHRPALRLLQAIRDEAHRFAVSYHRELRAKKLQESVLDDIPGIGESRKQALLQEFGSVRELKKASPEEIARRVPGIGSETAKLIAGRLLPR
jgi:excinuclease ABC subunit C